MLVVVNQYAFTLEDHQDDNGDLKYCMTPHISPHLLSDNWCILRIWHPIQDLSSRGLCCQSKGSECIHDQVNPKELYCVE